mmetsp:Transcript_6283/g.13817  ORF Transcript_6283/g.13817 Transcript_6283/m.13817 type:complete len:214 (+) Transcript_6283:824-1465(+)
MRSEPRSFSHLARWMECLRDLSALSSSTFSAPRSWMARFRLSTMKRCSRHASSIMRMTPWPHGSGRSTWPLLRRYSSSTSSASLAPSCCRSDCCRPISSNRCCTSRSSRSKPSRARARAHARSHAASAECSRLMRESRNSIRRDHHASSMPSTASSAASYGLRLSGACPSSSARCCASICCTAPGSYSRRMARLVKASSPSASGRPRPSRPRP